MNAIQILRKQTGLSQRKFAEELGIPVRTIQKWECGQSSPPDYVIQMIRCRLEEYRVVNMNTVKFIEMLNRLAEFTAHEEGEVWIRPFSEVTEKNKNDYLFYDEEDVPNESELNAKMHRIVNNMLVHDTIGEKKVLSTYNEWIPNVSVYYIVCPWEDATGGCIVVDINNGADEPIVISNGRWMSQSELDMQR